MFNCLVNVFCNFKDLFLEKGFNFIEGGWELFESLRDKIDVLFLYLYVFMIGEVFKVFVLKIFFKGWLLYV